MITLDRARQLIDHNLSLIVIGDNKIPWTKWKEYQTAIITKDKFEEYYCNDKTKGVGIITGYNNLEVIDVDLKVISGLPEQQSFWKEFISFLRDNIDSFDDKFVIYKTVNNGYHILYRCAKIEGNKKLAKLKGQTEAVIETRGVGGYVFVYENQVSYKDYTEIQEISELDRSVLMDICRIYNYSEDEIKIDQPKEYKESELKPWVDFNAKTSIFDILGTDFEVVRNIKTGYVIRRIGATSAHSGYIYKDSGCMYLFSSGTIYPHEKLINPFAAYAIKNFNGDFKAAASDIYKKGFGSRIIKQPKEISERPIINKSDLIFPIDIFPDNIQNYIMKCNQTLNSSIDYMGCSFMWMSSVIIGNSLQIKVKNGWKETSNLWISIVGKAGLGKTPSISNIIYPLMKVNNAEIKSYIKQNDKYIHFKSLDKDEQSRTEEIKKPIKTQFIVNDITLEALVDLHEESDNSVGVFKDELAGWFKDMNKYRAGSDLEFWLSSWSGKSVNLNRKTAKSAFVEKPLIPVLGGIQPSILNSFYTEENKDNGFIDRMLLSYPDLEIESYNDNELSDEIIEWYESCIVHFYQGVKGHLIKRNVDNDIDPLVVTFSKDAKKEWIRIFNYITTIQNSHDENEYMKSMLPKQKSYIPRFALIINTIDCFFNDKPNLVGIITKESIIKAEQLSNYFIAMAKKIKIDTVEKNDIKKVLEVNKVKSNKEKFTALYNDNKDLNRADVSEILGVSRNTIQRYIKEIDGKG